LSPDVLRELTAATDEVKALLGPDPDQHDSNSRYRQGYDDRYGCFDRAKPELLGLSLLDSKSRATAGHRSGRSCGNISDVSRVLGYSRVTVCYRSARF
ncbi:MAG: hypothetical protein MUQ10_03190, partial [Anaerolineae bacterium]|nr:hypothetical protein [Anaerolineae bacterium]